MVLHARCILSSYKPIHVVGCVIAETSCDQATSLKAETHSHNRCKFNYSDLRGYADKLLTYNHDNVVIKYQNSQGYTRRRVDAQMFLYFSLPAGVTPLTLRPLEVGHAGPP